MKSKSTVWMVVLGVLAVAAMVALLLSVVLPPAAEPARQTRDERPRRPKLIKSVRKTRPQKNPARPVQVVSAAAEQSDDMSPEDRKMLADIQDALDLDDLEKIRECLRKARGSVNPEIRKAIAEALGWFGTKAMSDLAPFIADENEEVRYSASSAWETILNDLDDEEVKVGLVVETMQVVRDEDVADSVAFTLTGVDERRAVNALVKLLTGAARLSKTGRQKLLETYEQITGEAFTDAKAAEAWLRENYTPPEKED